MVVILVLDADHDEDVGYYVAACSDWPANYVTKRGGTRIKANSNAGTSKVGAGKLQKNGDIDEFEKRNTAEGKVTKQCFIANNLLVLGQYLTTIKRTAINLTISGNGQTYIQLTEGRPQKSVPQALVTIIHYRRFGLNRSMRIMMMMIT